MKHNGEESRGRRGERNAGGGEGEGWTLCDRTEKLRDTETRLTNRRNIECYKKIINRQKQERE